SIELVRYDELLNAHYAAALQGDPLATDRVLSIMSRIERLHGVEAPKAEDGASETAAMLNQLLATSIERIN
ncbi:hypothetical protein C3L57_07935, partial [Veillonellaceae bacterium M2-8]|nr:hypothetical protein [Veillonellaceae bacterium M2-8]